MSMVLLAMMVEAVVEHPRFSLWEAPSKKSERVYTRQPNPAESIEVTDYEYDG
jgi:hypothetical protein